MKKNADDFVIILIVIGLGTLSYFIPPLRVAFFSEASGAAVGGFVGAIIVWFFRERFVRLIKRPRIIATYYVAHNKEEMYGMLMHQRGKRIEGITEIRSLLGSRVKEEVIQKGIWEWTMDDVPGAYKGTCAFFGPYSYDLPEPGTYRVRFHYYGRGFKAENNISSNPMLFHLDVIQKIEKDENIKVFNSDRSNKISDNDTYSSISKTKGKKYLYHKDFMEANEKETGSIADIIFYYDGQGSFEYRAYVPQNPKEALGNVKTLLDRGCRIFFYKVEVHQIFSVEVPAG